ncbi:hypothetical protein D7Z54_11550 [Salibacterium salarium]|uniref:Uncharacterized protein n=1 Tax=Salibacterium salarium TaxID=284579 RepID=A0A428N467_9BACI|nr:hypothetical protein [Salibacterium salarium]RSL33255.1 hypothetical protein D7Z54_11550 [Salibacterium salarium]
MISKIKQLSTQEWAILILFIISIITLIATIEWANQGENDNALVNKVEEVEELEDNVLTYDWTSN